MTLRISAFFLLLFSIIFLPFWVSVLIGLSLMAYFPVYVEAVFVFILVDLLYGAPEVKFQGITFVSLIGGALALFIVEILKKRLKYYPKY